MTDDNPVGVMRRGQQPLVGYRESDIEREAVLRRRRDLSGEMARGYETGRVQAVMRRWGVNGERTASRKEEWWLGLGGKREIISMIRGSGDRRQLRKERSDVAMSWRGGRLELLMSWQMQVHAGAPRPCGRLADLPGPSTACLLGTFLGSLLACAFLRLSSGLVESRILLMTVLQSTRRSLLLLFDDDNDRGADRAAATERDGRAERTVIWKWKTDEIEKKFNDTF